MTAEKKNCIDIIINITVFLFILFVFSSIINFYFEFIYFGELYVIFFYVFAVILSIIVLNKRYISM